MVEKINMDILKSHFEKGGRENTIQEIKYKIQAGVLEKENGTVIANLKIVDTGYRKIEHTCFDITRIFEIDQPTKCEHCGEVIK